MYVRQLTFFSCAIKRTNVSPKKIIYIFIFMFLQRNGEILFSFVLLIFFFRLNARCSHTSSKTAERIQTLAAKKRGKVKI